MKYETVNNLTLPKIGFGTWNIGGGTSPNRSLDAQSLGALKSALKLGYTHFDTAEVYANGHAEELLGQAMREADVPRESLFITTKVSPEHLRYDDIMKSCQASLKRLGIDHIDLYLIHWPAMRIDLAESFRALNQLVQDGKVRHLGVSNFDLKLIKQAQEAAATPILTNQVPYNLFDRTYAKNGVLEYCRENDILLTAYSPVKKGPVNRDKTIQAIAEAHQATSPQIALAWLTAQTGVITIPMSYDPGHQKENFEAAEIELTQQEMQRLDQLS